MIPKQITNSTGNEWIGTEYASICPFNSDNSSILLIKRDHFGLYNKDGTFIRDLPIPASGEPRWHRSLPNILYWITGNQLMIMDTTAGLSKVVHQFSEYPAYSPDGRNGITGCGESDLSEDGDHLVLTNALRTEVFTYTISKDVKSPTIKQISPIDGLKISPSNLIIVSDAAGIWVENSATTRRITGGNGHAAVCKGLDGEDYLIWCNSNDPLPPATCRNAIVKVRVKDGQQTCLLQLDWSLAVDISACNKGFALVSTYGNQAKGQYANQILKVALDGSGVEVLCDTNSIAVSYNAQPKAALSRDGSRFVFCSNSKRTTPPEYCDTFLGIIDAPAPTKVLKEVDFTGQDGKEWEWHFKVVNGKMTVRVFNKEDA